MQVFAQTPARGIINYDMTMQLRKNVAKKNPAMAAMLPETMTSKVKVAFEQQVFAITDEHSNSSGGKTQISMTTNGGRRILDLHGKRIRTENTFINKKYYTDTTFTTWLKITYVQETKQIAGYTCLKALLTDYQNKTIYTVWYTTAIPYAYNPLGIPLAGLRGAVLECGDENTNWIAVSIDLKGFTPAAVAPDATAKRVTDAQMHDLQDEALEQMQGGKGEKVIIN